MFNYLLKKQTQTYNRRSLLIFLSKFGLFSIIGWKLFNIQILNSHKYKTLSKKNQINFEILYPLRGEILDRNNKIIASNKSTYDLFLIPEQTNDVKETINELNKQINIDFKTQRKVIDLSKKVKKFESIKILNNINWQNLEIIEANNFNLKGIHLHIVPQRIYPYSENLSHILGYTNKPSEEDLQLPFISNMRTLNIGKTGVEKLFNENLIGKPGKREIEVNAFGKEIREISRDHSKKGKNIKISIDIDVQTFVRKQLSKHKAGSIVVIDSINGEIISMSSIPDYNPNLIINKPNQDYWNEILKNQNSPLTNRSIQGLYAPGSTFKMIVAFAALKKGVISTKDIINCEGKIEFGDRFFHCWKNKGHGNVGLVRAIKESCDVFFYELAKKVGIDDIAKVANEFGLGEISSLGFDIEKKGIIPTKKWKKRTLKKNWYLGETLNAGIGQGYVLCTPLQLAIMTARIANNGLKIEPKITKEKSKKQFDKINLKDQHFKLIKDCMFKVVNENMGTAFKSRSNEYKFSGKTGTSQVKKITLEERERDDFRKKELEWENKDHALFVGYMPSKKPRYAIAIVIEHGGSGASIAAPIAKNIFDYLNDIKKI